MSQQLHSIESRRAAADINVASTAVAVPRIAPHALRALVQTGDEHAVLDVREAGDAFDAHLLFSSIAPAARLGLDIERLVPLRSTPIVIVDEKDDIAEAAARKLVRWGYEDVRVLDGGVQGWRAAGFELFSGTNVPTKAFGEVIEHALHTPNIDAPTLKRLLDTKADVVVLDSRPFEEFQRMSIPGAYDSAGAELVYRALEAAPSPDTLVVVNCAGRTRSILGAQSLINAGIPNPVAALTGGTMAWLLEGFTLAHQEIRTAPRPSAATLAKAQGLAEAVALKGRVSIIDAETLAHFESDAAAGARSLYKFDVRDPREYEAGHAAGWRSGAGGQLVQALDEYVGTRRARIVLTDTDRVRARLTASWLNQLGSHEVYVIDDVLGQAQQIGPEPVTVLRDTEEPLAWIEPDALARLHPVGGAAAGTAVPSNTQRVLLIDVDDSLVFRRAHIAGAVFVAPGAVQSLLPTLLARQAVDAVVLTSRDGVLASLLAADLTRAAKTDGALAEALRALASQGAPAIQVLLGGTRRWQALGLPEAHGDEGNLTGQADRRYGAYDVPREQAAKAMVDYLEWELQLVEQLARDGTSNMAIRDFETQTATRSNAVLQTINASSGATGSSKATHSLTQFAKQHAA
ncbi:rhodanese-like domain-containing protein [Robbsia sp. KACC 23696]|uniref:rhodanese-like domain-containing protein n=1 Tax=Robbsia sp. KACC 23696 TaxID=3149231 RepID=UPI00325BBA82